MIHRNTDLGPLFPARATDPGTSKAAARRVVTDGTQKHQQAEVLRVIRAHPGLTSKELPAHCGLDRYQLARRCPELERLNLIERAGERDGAARWWPVEGNP